MFAKFGSKTCSVFVVVFLLSTTTLIILLFLLNSPLVLLYNLIARSYSCAAIEVVALASFALAVWRFDIHKQLCKS